MIYITRARVANTSRRLGQRCLLLMDGPETAVMNISLPPAAHDNTLHLLNRFILGNERSGLWHLSARGACFSNFEGILVMP